MLSIKPPRRPAPTLSAAERQRDHRKHRSGHATACSSHFPVRLTGRRCRGCDTPSAVLAASGGEALTTLERSPCSLWALKLSLRTPSESWLPLWPARNSQRRPSASRRSARKDKLCRPCCSLVSFTCAAPLPLALRRRLNVFFEHGGRLGAQTVDAALPRLLITAERPQPTLPTMGWLVRIGLQRSEHGESGSPLRRRSRETVAAPPSQTRAIQCRLLKPVSSCVP
jgi:hypothetical protein